MIMIIVTVQTSITQIYIKLDVQLYYNYSALFEILMINMLQQNMHVIISCHKNIIQFPYNCYDPKQLVCMVCMYSTAERQCHSCMCSIECVYSIQVDQETCGSFAIYIQCVHACSIIQLSAQMYSFYNILLDCLVQVAIMLQDGRHWYGHSFSYVIAITLLQLCPYDRYHPQIIPVIYRICIQLCVIFCCL